MTTVAERLRGAFTGWRAGEPVQRKAAKVNAPKLMQVWPDYRNQQPLWTLTDIQSFIDYGFNANAVIYAACMYRADAVNTAALRAYGGTPDDPDPLSPADPLARLLLRPNPYQSSHEFHALNSVFYALAGQSYIWFKRDKTGGVPVEMYTLRPDWVKIIPDGKNGTGVIGYIYVPTGSTLADGYPLLPEDVAHVKRPNPGDPLMGAGYGFSAMGPLAQSANVDNDVTKFLKVFFQSGAMFQNMVSFEGQHSPEDLAAVREKLKERYGGVENWNEWAVFDSSAKATRLSPTFDEMGFDAIDSRNEARILMALGVPPILVGARLGLERSTYSNYIQARQAFWEDRLLPEIRSFESEYQYYLSSDGKFVQYDLSDVPALRRDIEPLTKAAKLLVDMGTPPRLAYQTVGLNVPAYDGDMERYINTGGGNVLTPVSVAADAETATEATEAGGVTVPKMRKQVSDEGYAILYLDRVEGLINAQDQLSRMAEQAGAAFEITPRAELHITLVYAEHIGNASLRFIGEMIDEGNEFRKFELGGTDLEWFGEDETNKALVLRIGNGAGDADALRKFQARVYEHFEDLNIDLEMGVSEFSVPSNWKPHITLGYGVPFDLKAVDLEFDANRFVVARDNYQTVYEIIAPSQKAYDAQAMQRKMDTLAVNWEKRYGDQAVDLFREEQREISAMLSEMQQDAYRLKATPNWRALMGKIEQYYAETRPADWRAAFVPLLTGTMTEAGQEWATALGVTWDVRNIAGESWFQSYLLQFASPITENSSTAIHDVLAQGMAEGWSIPQAQDALDMLFTQWTEGDLSPEDWAFVQLRLPDYRREAIARTESLRAENAGALNLGKEWGAKRKFWIGSHDARIRDDHIAARDTYTEQGAIPIDDNFNVGGSAMNAPHDPSAPAKQVVNCRCALGLLMD